MYTEEFVRNFWNKVDKRGDDECWLWIASTAGKGYGQIRIPCTRKNAYSHRVAYELAHGPLPEKHFACHRCDTPRCCNPKHLFAGTSKENQQDMAAKKRSNWGARNKMAKTDEAKVDLIFKMYREGWSQAKIGVVVGLHQVQVGRILNGKRWGQYKPFTGANDHVAI
jgi:hypothetical protein